MDVIAEWLAQLGAADAPSLARALEALPGLAVYPGPHADPVLASFEWSVRAERDRIDAVRVAHSVAPDRVPPGAVLAFLRARCAIAAPLAGVIEALHGAHFQVGVAGRQAKLYVYARGAPPDAIDRILAAAAIDDALHRVARDAAGRPPAFAALDLDPLAAKLYFEHAGAAASAAMLEAVGAHRLAALARATPTDLGSAPAPFVVSVRAGTTGATDVTLHTKIDRAGDRLAALAGAPVRKALAALASTARSRGLTLTPTYLGRLDRGGELVETLYYGLAPDPVAARLAHETVPT